MNCLEIERRLKAFYKTIPNLEKVYITKVEGYRELEVTGNNVKHFAEWAHDGEIPNAKDGIIRNWGMIMNIVNQMYKQCKNEKL